MGNVQKLKNEGLGHILNKVHEYLRSNMNFKDEQEMDDFLDHRSTDEILDFYLRWEGIYGYTEDIYSLVNTLDKESE